MDDPKQVAVDVQDLAKESVNKAGEGRFDSQSLTAMYSMVFTSFDGPCMGGKDCVT